MNTKKTVLDRREFLGMLPVGGFVCGRACDSASAGEEPLGRIIENNGERITINADHYRASVVKKGYVSGVAGIRRRSLLRYPHRRSDGMTG